LMLNDGWIRLVKALVSCVAGETHWMCIAVVVSHSVC